MIRPLRGIGLPGAYFNNVPRQWDRIVTEAQGLRCSGESSACRLHRLYTKGRYLCPVFRPAALQCRLAVGTAQPSGRCDGYFVHDGSRGFLLLTLALIAGCAALERKTDLAYVLSAGIALALLVYLVAALIRAEDL